MNTPIAVQLTGVEKHYGPLHALNGIDLDVAEGEVLGLFGHNGAGKTTTMKLILGLLSPSAGSVRVFGSDPTGKEARQQRQRIGFLPENVTFYEQLTGQEVLRYFGRLKGVTGTACETLLERVGLAPAANRKVKTYSKGMRQRLGLAQALLGEPRLLLLDEPTVGLDPIATQDFYVMVDELKQRGCTVILCSHVLPGVERHIDRAAILGHGRLQALGTLTELRQQANLPLTIRVQGIKRRERLAACWQYDNTRVRPLNAHGLEIFTQPEHKVAIMRSLLQESVTDIELQAPSLEQLYRFFVESAQTAREATHERRI